MIGMRRKQPSAEATSFRQRLEMLMEQMAQDRSSPFGPYVPMLCGAMSSMGDEELLALRQFLKAVVGED